MKKIVLFFVIFSFIILFSKKSLGDNLVDCIPDPPSNSSHVTLSTNGNSFNFVNLGTGLKYTYNFDQGWSLNGVQVTLPNNQTFYPSYFGGLMFKADNITMGSWDSRIIFAPLFDFYIDGDTVKTGWGAFYGDRIYQFYFDISMIGNTAKVHLYSNQEGYRNFYPFRVDLDRNENSTNAHIIEVPSLSDMNLLFCNDVYTSAFFDWTKSNSSVTSLHDDSYTQNSKYFSQYTEYLPNTSGHYKLIDETIYITVSEDINDVLPNIPNPVSPYHDLSSEKIIMDWWDNYYYLYADSRFLGKLETEGIQNVWALIHDWQKEGYDRQLPVTYPAKHDPIGGVTPDMNILSQRLLNDNYLFSLHENYTSYSHDTPYYGSETYYRAKAPDGSERLTWDQGWYPPHIEYKLFAMKPSRILRDINISERQRYPYPMNVISQDVKDNYNTNSSYIDFHTNCSPYAFEDFDASLETTGEKFGSYGATMYYYNQIGPTLRNIHGGPVSAEGGAFMSYYAGYIDDFEADLRTSTYTSLGNVPQNGGYFRPLLVNYDLLKVHKKSFMHGVGYKERFFHNGLEYNENQGRSYDSLLIYVATELAYGRGGQFQSYINYGYRITDSNFIYDQFIKDAKLQWDYVLPMQQYLKGTPVSILYGENGETASQYIKTHPNWDKFDEPDFMGKVRVEYDNGAIVYVNRSNIGGWTVPILGSRVLYDYHGTIRGTSALNVTSQCPGREITLPKQSGWLCVGPPCLNCPELENPEERPGKKFSFSLSQNYPNPFNPNSTIKYSLAKREFVTIKIFDILGKEVMSLENSFKDEGEYSVNFDGSKLASGMYFYQINAQDYINTKKMLLIK